jgi:type IV pilus assembly protein PilW
MVERTHSRCQGGFTLVELMVAMVLGLLVAAGIVTVFASTSSSNKAQDQVARLQEEGRFAISRLSTELRMANGQYCNNTGGVAAAASGGKMLDQIRAPTVYAQKLTGTGGALSDVTTGWGTGAYPAAPSAPYSMPSFLYMRGYDCSLTACTPVDPSNAVTAIPTMGTALNSRVKGADVITVRYVNPASGWSIGAPGGSTLATSGSTGTITSITLSPLTAQGEPPLANFTSGDLVMLADCSNAQIFAASFTSPTLTPLTDTSNGFGPAAGVPSAQPPESVPKVFDVNRDFQTVTYYLKVVSVNNNDSAPFTGALMRRVNGGIANAVHGGSEDELVRGVERMDFKYGVQDASGNISFLTAAQVDSSTNCPPAELNAITTTGCLWRGVTSVEVSLLMDGQAPLATLADNDLFYSYSNDSNTGLLAPEDSSRTVKPTDQGFPDHLLRREFNVLVPVRNYNP